jgi:NDP-hexose 4-ketoreductase
MKVLVLGGTGFVGRHLIAALVRHGNQVTFTGRRESSVATVPGTTYVSCDSADAEALLPLVDQVAPEAIVNLIGASAGTTESLCRTNVSAAIAALVAASRTRPRARLLHFGSAAEYGNAPSAEPLTEHSEPAPVGPYGVTKLAATRTIADLAPSLGVAATVLRPFNVVGAGCPDTLFVGAVVERLHRALAGSGQREIIVGRVDTMRDFVAVADVVEATLLLLATGSATGIFNVCSGLGTPTRAVLDLLVGFAGGNASWRTDPALVRPDDPPVSIGSSALLRATTGFMPSVPLERALHDAWTYRCQKSPGEDLG